VRGEIAHHDVSVLELSALKGLFADVVDDAVSYVNAPLLAKDKGVDVTLMSTPDSPDFRNVVEVRAVMADGAVRSVAGTLAGRRQREKIVEVNGFDVDVLVAPHTAFLTYVDRPGVVGALGGILGEQGINIAGMQVSRTDEGGEALVVLTVDSAIPAPTLDLIAQQIGASSVAAASLTD
jgi:D-3-phosphoglycerate dehydrogenase